MAFTKATKKQAKLRLALEAPAGYGKTYTALLIASQLLEGTGKRIAFLDTEGRGQGSASLYAHLFDFDVDEIKPPFHPDRIVQSIEDAVANDYGAWVGDSWSHFWQGTGGMLDIVDQVAKAKYRGDTHSAWKDAGEIEQRVLDALLGAPLHIIVCMRMKTDSVREEFEHEGRKRTRIRNAGLKAIQREGFDYEFSLAGRFEVPTIMTVSKTRIDAFPPDTFIEKPGYSGPGATEDGRQFVPRLKAWLEDGAPEPKLEKPSAADRKKLDKVIAELVTLDGAHDWAEIADKAARRDFGHGIGALSKPELETLVVAMGKHRDELKAKSNGKPADESAQAALEGATA